MDSESESLTIDIFCFLRKYYIVEFILISFHLQKKL